MGDDVVTAAARILTDVRRRKPLIHCITNDVTRGAVAEALTAFGASPIMATASEEVEQIAGKAGSLVLNLGTPSRERYAVAIAAGRAASSNGVPIVVDPVGIAASPWRLAGHREVLASCTVHAIRANAAELEALLSGKDWGSGVGTGDFIAPAALAHGVACQFGCTVGMTGATDYVADAAGRSRGVANGHPLLAAVSGTGCLATAIVGACLAVSCDSWYGTIAGLLVAGVAGELAAEDARGPGTLATKLIDWYYNLTSELLIARARLV